LALRQQLTVLKRHNPRPGLGNFDRLFWVVARRLWSGTTTDSCVHFRFQARDTLNWRGEH
jgi:hypothetical protein